MPGVKFGFFRAYFYMWSGLKNIVLEKNQKHILAPSELQIQVSQV